MSFSGKWEIPFNFEYESHRRISVSGSSRGGFLMIECIKTKRLTLEPFSERHLENGIVDWLNDPEVVRYSDNRHRKHTLETSRAYLESFADSPNYYWAILLQGLPKTMIGSVTAYLDLNNSVADVGILVGDKRYWRGAYGSEAFAAVVEWLFSRRGMRKVTAGTMAVNTGMLGIMRKIGMREDGRKARYYLLDGNEIDMVCGTVFAEDWRMLGARQNDRIKP
jgi:[ribosomal protein S5]-alanine N-acetyltransferase